MNLYSGVLALHVISAILGVGQLAAATVLTSFGAATPMQPLQRVLRFGLAGLGLMLVSGVAIEALTQGAHSHLGWFRLSFALFLVVGFLHARVRRALRQAGEPPSAEAIRRANRILWIMCGGVAAIALLMEAKPF